MVRIVYCCAFLATLLFFSSCAPRWQKESEEVANWNSRVEHPVYERLYRDGDLSFALARYDSLAAHEPEASTYAQAARYLLKARYYYFFTSENASTSRMLDSGLAVLHTPALQQHYPRTTVHFLLFGGQIAYRLQQYSKANDYFFRARKLGDAHLDPCERKDFSYSIAMVLYRQQNYKQSLKFFEEAYALQSTCRPQTTAVVLQQQEIQSNIGLCLVQLKQYDCALAHFDSAIRISEQYRDSLGPISMKKIRGVIDGHKAQVYQAMGRLDQAKRLCLRSIALNGRPGYEMIHALQVRLQLADIYRAQKDFPAMYEVLARVRTELDAMPDAEVELGWRQQLAAYYEETDQQQLGLPVFKRYIALRDSLLEQKKKLIDADANRQLEGKEQQLQIAILKRDKQMAVITLWVTVVFTLMALSIMVLVYKYYRRSKKNLAESLALNEEIRRQKAARVEEARLRNKAITKAVIQAQEKERSLIGLELHDNINQVLTTVKLHNELVLEGLGDPKVVLPKASRHLQDCINEIRSLSRRLSAPTLGKISLEESVNDLLESINATQKISITREINGLDPSLVPQDLHLGLYRILQEQLNNVLKHAEASEVCVQLEARENYIRLCVTDNGKGFEMNGPSTGIGLMNMRTRAEHLNGTFKLRSAPGAGCLVEVVVPCMHLS